MLVHRKEAFIIGKLHKKLSNIINYPESKQARDGYLFVDYVGHVRLRSTVDHINITCREFGSLTKTIGSSRFNSRGGFAVAVGGVPTILD